MEITIEQVRHVADLARLYLSDEEAARLTKDMGNVLEMAGALSRLDTQQVQPMTHAVAITNVFREDVCAPCYPRETILGNSASQDGETFIVPQVVE